MRVMNVHKRELEANSTTVGALMDSLASREDRLWPVQSWPPMKFDRPWGVGATGGHGPIRYFVEAYEPGKMLTFRFTSPRGFDGFHTFKVISIDDQRTVLQHTINMHTNGMATFTWMIIYRPMHDALLEDALTTAQQSLGLEPSIRPWSVWVRMLRWLVSRGKARSRV